MDEVNVEWRLGSTVFELDVAELGNSRGRFPFFQGQIAICYGLNGAKGRRSRFIESEICKGRHGFVWVGVAGPLVSYAL